MVEIEIEKAKKEANEAIKNLIKKGMLTEEHLKKQKKCTEELSKIRGEILHRSIETEMMLGSFLVTYFTYEPYDRDFEKTSNFMEIMNKMSFQRKIEIFKKIGFHNKKNFNEKYKDFEKILESIKESRNMIAHSIQMNFIRPVLGNRKKKIELNQDYLNKFHTKADLSMIVLDELISKLIEEKF